MKILVIGDVHNKTAYADSYLKRWEGSVVFLGDYFDNFDDSPDDAINTAVWLKHSLQQPNRIHLIGNHDFHYMLPVGSGTYCSGYTLDKHKAIANIFSQGDWSQLKYFHAINNCWFSHAGVSYKWFSHPVTGVTRENVEAIITRAKQDIQARIYKSPYVGALWAADHYRGGFYDKGGLLWCDWRNIDFFKDITQVVGHTPRESIKSHSRKGGTNINVDTHLKQAIILDTDNNSYEILNYEN